MSRSQVIGSQVGKVYTALADYDPAEQSDKEDNEVDDELVLTAGCRMRIVQDMDEDGFFVAEHLEGPDAGAQVCSACCCYATPLVNGGVLRLTILSCTPTNTN